MAVCWQKNLLTARSLQRLLLAMALLPEIVKFICLWKEFSINRLPPNERFLSFDRLWEMYEDETPVKNDEDFYNYRTPDSLFIKNICKISFDAYKAVRGKGYGRIDIRMDKNTGKMYVLEVNAQCGLSEDENFTSIGAILRLSGNSFGSLIATIMQNALTHTHVVKQKKAKQLELI